MTDGGRETGTNRPRRRHPHMGWDWDDDDDDDAGDALVVRHHGVKNVVNRKRVRQIVSVLGTGAEARNAGVARQPVRVEHASIAPEDAHYSPYHRRSAEVHATPVYRENPYRSAYEDSTSPSPFAMPPARHYAVTPGGTRRVVWRDEFASADAVSRSPGRPSLEEVREMSVDRSPTATYRPASSSSSYDDPRTPPPARTSEGWGGKPWKAWGGRTPGGYSDRSDEWSDTPTSRRDISIVDEDVDDAAATMTATMRPGTPAKTPEPAPPPSTRGARTGARSTTLAPAVRDDASCAPSPAAGRDGPIAGPGASPARFELNARPARDDEDDDEGVIEMLEHAHVHTVTKIREMRRELNARAEALDALGPQLDALAPQLDGTGPKLDAPRSSLDASHREPGRVSALLARYEREIGGLREEVETLRSAVKPPRPTPAPRRRGDAATPAPERVEPKAEKAATATTATATTTVGSTPPLSAAALVRDDRRLNKAEQRAPVEPGPSSPVALARSRTTTRDGGGGGGDDDDERRTVPVPAWSPRRVNSPPPANLAFARARPGGRAAPPAHPSPAPDSDAVPLTTATKDLGPAKEPGPAKDPGPATNRVDEANHEASRVVVSGLARSRRGAGASEGPTTTPGGPAAAANKWGAVKGKVVAPRTPGVADVATRVVAEMARSRRPTKD